LTAVCAAYANYEIYRWLNDLVCIAEGQISAAGPDMVINIYAGIHEMQSTAVPFEDPRD
jgi:hypothetical protein